MKPDRWKRITDIFHAALARDDSSRHTFLDQACRDDPALRDEVERLLASHRDAGTFGDRAVSATVAHLKHGSSFGPYIVGELLGAGGMGEVYRARDPKLGRDVAIKVLPAAVTSDPDRLSRFTREARLLASLNHPNIGAIYEVEDASGVQGLVLELIDGTTLSDRLARGALPIREALGIARQIAAALEAAHERGIVHRDLKPANVKVTAAGLVKVIDFGIAKGVEPDVSAAATETGFIIGTAAYMSPEQARGGPIDKRTDIWAFGCVVYEMLTGQQPFDAKTSFDTIARILEHEPAWDRLPSTVPEAIVRLLRRCLSKDPSERLHDIADARLEIADAMSLPVSGLDRNPAIARSNTRWVWVALTSATAIVGATIWYRKAVGGSDTESHVVTVDGVRLLVPTDWSRDGQYILYDRGRGARSLWALPLFGDRKPVQVIDAKSIPYSGHISPDGQWLAYASMDTGRYEVYVQRFPGPGRKERISSDGGAHPRWTADGRELVYWAVPRGIEAVSFEATGSTFRIGPRRTIVQSAVLSLIDARTHYDITRDGKRLLLRQPAGPQEAGLTVILNWTAKLK